MDASRSLHIEICKHKYTSFHCTSATERGFMPLQKWFHVCGLFTAEEDAGGTSTMRQKAELYLNGKIIASSKS